MGPFHWKNRFLRITEIKRLQTFNNNHVILGDYKDQWRQIGNAVPVNFAYAIGLSLVKLLNDIETSDMKTELPIVQSSGQISFNL